MDLDFTIGADVWTLVHVAAEEDSTAQVRMTAHFIATIVLLAILGTATEPATTLTPCLET